VFTEPGPVDARTCAVLLEGGTSLCSGSLQQLQLLAARFVSSTSFEPQLHDRAGSSAT